MAVALMGIPSWFLLVCCSSFLLLLTEASHHIYSHSHIQTVDKVKPDAYHRYRTGYHFQPVKNWINDPNGPLIYKGIYHLFYQYNPNGTAWGNIVWAHSTSTDLVNWTPHPPAIYPSQPADVNGCWSGSATILPGDKPAILYTGIDPENRQVQNLATPKNLSDPYLKEWVKYPNNPLMAPSVINKINASSFRDPTTAWMGLDKRWRVIVGSKRRHRGLAILYRSKDFVHWTKSQHPLHSANGTGMWECPDFYPVGLDPAMSRSKAKYVLKVSLDDTKHEYYTIGTYDEGKDVYTPDEGSIENDSGLRYDYGKFYASKSFFDSEKKRRILWGWINESSTPAADAEKGWSGVQAIPRNMWLHKSGKQLMQWPIMEIEKFRSHQVNISNKLLSKGSIFEVSGVTAAQADVEVAFKIQNFDKAEVMDPSWRDPQLVCSMKGASVGGGIGPFGLLVLASKDMQEHTAVYFRVFKSQTKYVVLMCSDQSRSSLNDKNDKTSYGAFLNVNPSGEELSLRTLIDHSIVESFGGGGASCITARVYPTLAIDGAAHLYVFNNGSTDVTISGLSAWTMGKAQVS